MHDDIVDGGSQLVVDVAPLEQRTPEMKINPMIKQLSLLFITMMCLSLDFQTFWFTQIVVHCAFPSLCFSDAPSIFQNIYSFIFFDSNFVDSL
jgi:hypothetical protein